MRELPIPPDAMLAKDATELARGWIVDGSLQCSLFPSVWAETPEAWGILLADFAAHIADAIAQDSEMDREQIHRIISKKLIEELEMPSAKHIGDHIDHE